ncbi:hypothetical protein CIPAW_03G125300 [Carya illinoinensis]|uniref:Uncharacterized protein n=1 Tax=Carya illinoinensis TaxID=32201 RepID=A0A8T1R1X2_CARIL|nr:hypothetical protein CIPAW_03G125300 [Carya illinoinensis]
MSEALGSSATTSFSLPWLFLKRSLPSLVKSSVACEVNGRSSSRIVVHTTVVVSPWTNKIPTAKRSMPCL